MPTIMPLTTVAGQQYVCYCTSNPTVITTHRLSNRSADIISRSFQQILWLLTTVQYNLQCFQISQHPLHCCFSGHYWVGLPPPRWYRTWFTVSCFPLVIQYTNVKRLLFLFVIQELSVALTTTNSRTLSDNITRDCKFPVDFHVFQEKNSTRFPGFRGVLDTVLFNSSGSILLQQCREFPCRLQRSSALKKLANKKKSTITISIQVRASLNNNANIPTVLFYKETHITKCHKVHKVGVWRNACQRVKNSLKKLHQKVGCQNSCKQSPRQLYIKL